MDTLQLFTYINGEKFASGQQEIYLSLRLMFWIYIMQMTKPKDQNNNTHSWVLQARHLYNCISESYLQTEV